MAIVSLLFFLTSGIASHSNREEGGGEGVGWGHTYRRRY